MEVPEMTYVLLTPVKNEERYIESTLRSVTAQTVLPVRWIIVNDQSTDGTTALIEQYAAQFPWIDHLYLSDFETGLHTTGGRSGALMNYARQLIHERTAFTVKIDSDLAFAPNFFERIFREFDRDPKLGLASGHLVQDGIPEKIVSYTTNRGATRIYRTACFEAIGSYYTSRGEDQMDTYKAQFLGWKTRTFDVYFDHLKPEGIRSNWVKSHYATGMFKAWIPYRFLFFLGTVAKNIPAKPFFLGSMVQLYAYCYTRFIQRKRPFEKAVCNYIRQQQWHRMTGLFRKTNSSSNGLQ